MILVAKRMIRKGDEISNNYGIHHNNMVRLMFPTFDSQKNTNSSLGLSCNLILSKKFGANGHCSCSKNRALPRHDIMPIRGFRQPIHFSNS